MIAQTLGGLAQWIDIFLIFSVPSFVWKSSPSQIAVLASLFGLPGLFLGPIVGAFLDRSNSSRLLLWAATLRTGLSVLIAFVPEFNAFAVLVLAKGLVNLVYWSSSAIVTNYLVPEAARVRYFATLSGLGQLTKIGTPALAGLLTLFLPSQTLFLVSAAATLLCVLALRLILSGLTLHREAAPRSLSDLFHDLKYGFSAMKSLSSELKISVAFGVGMSFVLAIYDPHLASFLNSKNFEPSAFSSIVTATGVGALVAASIIRVGLKKASMQTVMRIGVGIFCLALVLVALIIQVTPNLMSTRSLSVLWFVNGFGYEFFAIGASVTTQNLCPAALIGRISTSSRSMQLAAVVVGPSVGAWLIEIHGRSAPFVVAAFSTLLLLGAAVAWGRNRAEDRTQRLHVLTALPVPRLPVAICHSDDCRALEPATTPNPGK